MDHRAVWGQTPLLSLVLQSLPTDLQKEPEVLDAVESWGPVVIGEVGVVLVHGQDVLLDSAGTQYQ